MNLILKSSILLMFILFISSCSSDSNFTSSYINLGSVLQTNKNQVGESIAFALKESTIGNQTSVVFIAKKDATDFKLYTTLDLELASDDYDQYTLETELNSNPYLTNSQHYFTLNDSQNKWAIVTQVVKGVVFTSEPIKIQVENKPTEYHDDIAISKRSNGRAKFDWLKKNDFNKYFYQIIQNNQDSILSATFTVENTFLYYDTTNVTLNLTPVDPPKLVEGNIYKTRVFAIGQNNWVPSYIYKEFLY